MQWAFTTILSVHTVAIILLYVQLRAESSSWRVHGLGRGIAARIEGMERQLVALGKLYPMVEDLRESMRSLRDEEMAHHYAPVYDRIRKLGDDVEYLRSEVHGIKTADLAEIKRTGERAEVALQTLVEASVRTGEKA